MSILLLLLGEHGALRHQLDALRLAAPRFSDDQLRAATLAFAEAIESHAAIEEQVLFEPLAAAGGMPRGPIEAMCEEHRQIERLLGQLLAPAAEPGRPDPQRTLARLVETVRHHFDHEECALFPMAARTLEGQALETMAARWCERRGCHLPPPANPSASSQPLEILR